jgi:hypothetical protein
MLGLIAPARPGKETGTDPMSFDYRIDLARGLVITLGSDTLTGQDLLGHTGKLAKDPQFRADMREFLDLRGVTKLEIAGSTVRALARLNPFGAGARRALLVGSDVAFGMARMYQTFRDTSPDELEVFRDLDPALEWLELTQDAAVIRAALAALHPSIP